MISLEVGVWSVTVCGDYSVSFWDNGPICANYSILIGRFRGTLLIGRLTSRVLDLAAHDRVIVTGPKTVEPKPGVPGSS